MEGNRYGISARDEILMSEFEDYLRDKLKDGEPTSAEERAELHEETLRAIAYGLHPSVAQILAKMALGEYNG